MRSPYSAKLIYRNTKGSASNNICMPLIAVSGEFHGVTVPLNDTWGTLFLLLCCVTARLFVLVCILSPSMAFARSQEPPASANDQGHHMKPQRYIPPVRFLLCPLCLV